MSGGTFGRGPEVLAVPAEAAEAIAAAEACSAVATSSGQRYSLTLAISARNIFNNVNEGTPVGVISSPIFGQANSLAGGP